MAPKAPLPSRLLASLVLPRRPAERRLRRDLRGRRPGRVGHRRSTCRGVPAVTVPATSPDLGCSSTGSTSLRGQPYDGVIEERYPGGAVKSLRVLLPRHAARHHDDVLRRRPAARHAQLSRQPELRAARGLLGQRQHQVRLHLRRRQARGTAAAVVPQRRALHRADVSRRPGRRHAARLARERQALHQLRGAGRIPLRTAEVGAVLRTRGWSVQ